MLLFAGCATNLFAPIPIEERQYEVILENLEKSKAELFDLSLEWLAKTFKDSKSVIEVKNKEKGLIIGKGKVEVITVMGGITGINFIITINVRENRVRFKYENLSYYSGSPLTEGDRFVLVKAIEDLKKVSDSFQNYVKESTDNNNW